MTDSLDPPGLVKVPTLDVAILDTVAAMGEAERASVEGSLDDVGDMMPALETEIEDKTAHPLELFFDLVFVFAITQVVSLVVHDLTLAGSLRGALLLALMWWAWTNWTWTTNVVDLEPRIIRVAVLVSMLGVFGMAFAVPTAFAGDGDWLAFGYVLVRGIAAVVFVTGTRHDPAEMRAVLMYLPVSLGATAIVLVGGLVGGEALQWIWLGAILLELAATALAGQADWKVDAAHFAERHGLILIIALGEGIIVVGITLEGTQIDQALALQLAVGLAGVGALWWAYFDRLQEVMEGALRAADAHETGHIARDVYSLLRMGLPSFGRKEVRPLSLSLSLSLSDQAGQRLERAEARWPPVGGHRIRRTLLKLKGAGD